MKRKAMVVTGFMLAAWLLGQLGSSARAWQVTLSEGRGNRAYAVAVDSAGDVLVAGETIFADYDYVTVVKLSGTNGALLWRYDNYGGWGSAGVAVDSAGDVVVTEFRHYYV